MDLEAVAWAYNKLRAFGVGNTQVEAAIMLDRLNRILMDHSRVPEGRSASCSPRATDAQRDAAVFTLRLMQEYGITNGDRINRDLHAMLSVRDGEIESLRASRDAAGSSGWRPTHRFLLIEHGDNGWRNATVTAYATEVERERATTIAIFGSADDAPPATEHLEELRATGFQHYEGDAPIQWIDLPSPPETNLPQASDERGEPK